MLVIVATSIQSFVKVLRSVFWGSLSIYMLAKLKPYTGPARKTLGLGDERDLAFYGALWGVALGIPSGLL